MRLGDFFRNRNLRPGLIGLGSIMAIAGGVLYWLPTGLIPLSYIGGVLLGSGITLLITEFLFMELRSSNRRMIELEKENKKLLEKIEKMLYNAEKSKSGNAAFKKRTTGSRNAILKDELTKARSENVKIPDLNELSKEFDALNSTLQAPPNRYMEMIGPMSDIITDRSAQYHGKKGVKKLARWFVDNRSKVIGNYVLWFDDNATGHSAETETLRAFGLTVECTASVEDTLSHVRSRVYSFIISKVMADDGKAVGFHLAEALRNMEKHVEIIYYTSELTLELIVKARSYGAFGITNSPMELFELVKELLKKKFDSQELKFERI